MRVLPPKTLPRHNFQTPGESMQIKTPMAWARELQYLIRLIDQTEDPAHTTRALCQMVEAFTPTQTPKCGLKTYLNWRKQHSRDS